MPHDSGVIPAMEVGTAVKVFSIWAAPMTMPCIVLGQPQL